MSPLSQGIGSLNESTLHAAIKEWYAQPQDRFEVSVDGSIIDLIRGTQLIEIQTSNFAALRKKLTKLIDRHPVRVIYPLARFKWIVRTSGKGDTLGKRKSSKIGKLIDIFEELIRIPDLIKHPNFALEILVVDIEEVRTADGKGSRWRKGVSIKDRRLVQVVESHELKRVQDYLRFLPDGLESPFTNKTLADALGIQVFETSRITYTMRRMGLLERTGKYRNELLYVVNI